MVRNKYTLLREETKMDLVSVFVFQIYVLIRFNVTATYFMNIIHDVELVAIIVLIIMYWAVLYDTVARQVTSPNSQVKNYKIFK